MEKDIERRLSELQDWIESAEYALERAKHEFNGLWDKLEGKSYTVIKDINNLKRELERDGLYSDKMDNFLESYMNYYNN